MSPLDSTGLTRRTALAPNSRQNQSISPSKATNTTREVTDADIKGAYRVAPMTTDPKELGDVRTMAKLAKYEYFRDPAQLPGDWSPVTAMLERLSSQLNIPLRDQVDGKFGTLIDKESGLVATILASPSSKSLVVSFGGTTAGDKVGELLSRVTNNQNSNAKQWGANFAAGLGSLPTSYKQAKQLVETVDKLMKDKASWAGDTEMTKGAALPWANYELSAVGHSLGAGEAAFAALSQPTPLKANIFSPAHLSEGLMRLLTPESLQQAPDKVQAYSVSGDPVANLRRLPLVGIRGVGTEHVIPADPSRGRKVLNAIDVHDQFDKHLDAYIAQVTTPTGV